MNQQVCYIDPDIAVQADKQSVWHHLTNHKPMEDGLPMVMVEGHGLRVKDATGREYLDAVSGGLWTVNVGYGRETIAKAVYEQLAKMNFFSPTAGNVPAALFAEKLLEKMPGMGRVYYSTSGSEANEKAYKIVRQIAHKKYVSTAPLRLALWKFRIAWNTAHHGARFLTME